MVHYLTFFIHHRRKKHMAASHTQNLITYDRIASNKTFISWTSLYTESDNFMSWTSSMMPDGIIQL